MSVGLRLVKLISGGLRGTSEMRKYVVHKIYNRDATQLSCIYDILSMAAHNIVTVETLPAGAEVLSEADFQPEEGNTMRVPSKHGHQFAVTVR